MSKLSDDELVRLCSEQVMGWTLQGSGTNDQFKEWVNAAGEVEAHHSEWNPLKDWNQAQQVIEAIAMLNYNVRKAFQVALMKDDDWYADISQHAICEAALAAVKGRAT